MTPGNGAPPERGCPAGPGAQSRYLSLVDDVVERLYLHSVVFTAYTVLILYLTA